MPTPHHPTAAVRKALSKLGADIRDARHRRKLPMAAVGERAFTSRSTLQRIEAGVTSRFAAHRRFSIGVFLIWLYVAITGPICYLMLEPCY